MYPFTGMLTATPFLSIHTCTFNARLLGIYEVLPGHFSIFEI